MNLGKASGTMETRDTSEKPSDPKTVKQQTTSGPLLLTIRINAVPPGPIVPGAHKLFCYWKNHLLIDVANQMTTLYVPPEWRVLEYKYLKEWTCVLRRWPFQNYVFGGVAYVWIKEFLIPAGQDSATIPVSGQHGWPEFVEFPRIWNTPLPKLGPGAQLPVVINQAHRLDQNMEIVTCYWPMEVPRNPGIIVYVPPEWKQLQNRTQKMWISKAYKQCTEPFHLGGTPYTWKGNVLLPVGQRTDRLPYVQRMDRPESVKQKTVIVPATKEDPLTLNVPPTIDDIEVAEILRNLLDKIPKAKPVDLPVLSDDDLLSIIDNAQGNHTEPLLLPQPTPASARKREHPDNSPKRVRNIPKKRRGLYTVGFGTTASLLRDSIIMLE